jgi:hypothetical protein
MARIRFFYYRRRSAMVWLVVPSRLMSIIQRLGALAGISPAATQIIFC